MREDEPEIDTHHSLIWATVATKKDVVMTS